MISVILSKVSIMGSVWCIMFMVGNVVSVLIVIFIFFVVCVMMFGRVLLIWLL